MAVRELAPDEKVVPFVEEPKASVRELRPDEKVVPFNEEASMKISVGGRKLDPKEEIAILTEGDTLFAEQVAKSESDAAREAERQKFMQERNPVDRFGRMANVGISENPLSLTVDGLNFLLGLTGLPVSEEPFLGSRQLRRGFEALGIAAPLGEEDPDTLAGSMGRVTGAATGFLLPLVGLGGKAATAVETGLRAAPTTIRGKIVQDIGKTAIESPGKFLAAETISAAGAGTGGFIAREKFPDSEAASFIGEVLGGLTPAGTLITARTAAKQIGRIPGAKVIPKIIPTVTGIRLARAILRPFTKSGKQLRAERRAQGAARDPESAIAGLKGEFDETLPEAGLTPVQKTGDEGLLALERSVIDSSEQLKGQADEQIAQATKAIRESIEGFGEHVPIEKTEVALDEARAYVQSLMDTRMRIAAFEADEAIAALGPKATREDANRVTMEIVEAARADMNAHVRQQWAVVPETVILPTKNSTAAYKKIVKDTPTAQRHNIPAIAGKLLGRDADVPEGFEAAFEAFGLTSKSVRFGEKTTVKELQGLRSELLEQGRTARAAGEFNKARIADELAEAVLADLGAQAGKIKGEAGEALRSALDATAHMKQLFDRGPVGKLLGTDKRGAARVPEELTLETTTGKGGPRGKVETQAILEAADTPALRGAVEDFLLDDFARRGGVKKGEAFLKRHQDTLEDFPELRTKIEKAIETGSTAELAAAKAEGLAKRLNDPRVSRAAVFLKEPVEGAMERIAKSPRPDKTMREIIKQALRDTTGDAIKGLKTGLGDLLLNRASTRIETTTGDFVVSGRKLKQLLEDGPVSKMFKTLFSPAEQKRMLELADVAEKVQKAVLATPKAEGIIADNPSILFSTLFKIGGAKAGRSLKTGTIQAPAFMVKLFERFRTGLTRDPARRLLIDAMSDEDLFASLLTGGTKPITKAAKTKLNAWLLSIGAEQIRENE